MKKAKYIVRVFILKFDENGNVNSENFEYTFNEPNLMDGRNKAIEKTKNLKSFFEDEMPEENKFSSFVEAELKGFKNFNSYSLEVIFLPDEDGWDHVIYGEEELMIESLEAEAHYYMNNLKNQKFTEIEDESGELVQILESNNQFFFGLN